MNSNLRDAKIQLVLLDYGERREACSLGHRRIWWVLVPCEQYPFVCAAKGYLKNQVVILEKMGYNKKVLGKASIHAC